MTEEEWLGCADPKRMFEFARENSTDRKLRLFAVACCWPLWASMTQDSVSLAHAAYDERILPTGNLDPVRLAILSDSLEDAGCTNATTLAHLHGSGPHIRGCWAVDLVLGLE